MRKQPEKSFYKQSLAYFKQFPHAPTTTWGIILQSFANTPLVTNPQT
jgi:hypothetical protein